jgi:hypothetical protein
MKPFFSLLLFCIICTGSVTYAQPTLNRATIFDDTSVINATLNVNIPRLLKQKDKEGYTFPATFSCRLGDSMSVTDQMAVEVRGHFRRGYCYLPPLKLIFNANPAATLSSLKALKLVAPCMEADMYQQYLLKEYVIYKIYNLLTDKSFKVRLLNLTYQDSSGKKKAVTEHAFLLEDAKDIAKRNGCKEWEQGRPPTETTDRRQMTMVAIFEYMIGNTDWAVPVYHNIKLIKPKKDSLARPYVVPYDFDFSGLVNTNYSAPNEQLGIENVQQRLYRGFPRTMGEINEVLEIFKNKKASIYATINNFNLLSVRSKKDMTGYLDSFFEMIKNPGEVENEFITNARTE